MKLDTELDFGDVVEIDGGKWLKATVIGFRSLAKGSCEVLVSYFEDNIERVIYLDDYRLKKTTWEV